MINENTIKPILRQILESDFDWGEHKTQVFKSPKTANKKPTQADIAKLQSKVNDHISKYGDDPYFNNINDGQGIYGVRIPARGDFPPTAIHTPVGRINDADIGLLRQTKHGTNYTYVKADSAKDARIKVYTILGDDIIDNMKSQIGDNYLTGDKEDFSHKMDDKTLEKKKRKDLEKTKYNKPTLSMSDEEKEEFLKRQEKLKQKYDKIRKKK